MNNGAYTDLRRSVKISQVERMLKCVLGVVLFCLCYFLAVHSINDCKYSDIRSHIRIAYSHSVKDILLSYLQGNDLLWHTLVRGAAHVPGFTRNDTACFVTAGALTASYLIACFLFEREDPELANGAIAVGCFVFCMVSSIVAPWYSDTIYIGIGSPNPWHSPTHITMRPFAIIVFAMTAMIYNRMRGTAGEISVKAYRSRGEAVLYALMITLSVYAKPSLFQVMVPGLGILMVIDLIRTRGKSFLFSLKMAAAYVPGAVLTLMLFVSSFGQESGGGVEIAPFVVWGHYTKNIPFAILLVLAFPIFVFVADYRNFRRDAESPLAVSVLAVGTLMKALLAETGSRRWHGNFGWGYTIGCCLIWYVAIKKFLRMMAEDERADTLEYKIVSYVGYTLLALHFVSGIIYVIRLANGTSQC